jgi:hypothetical protein
VTTRPSSTGTGMPLPQRPAAACARKGPRPPVPSFRALPLSAFQRAVAPE